MTRHLDRHRRPPHLALGPRAARRPLAMERLESRLALAANVVVTEIHFAPRDPDPGSSFASAQEFEFIELKNIGDTSQQLQGWSFVDGFDFTFGNLMLAPGAETVVVRNQAAFTERYGAISSPIAGQFANGTGLSNRGERVELQDNFNATVVAFEYQDDWYPLATTGGHSLVAWDETADPALLDLLDGWRLSATRDGSPGEEDAGVYPGAIVINEIASHTDGFPEDWIELHNTSNQSVNLDGWYLSDNNNDFFKYEIIDVVIPAGGYRVWTQVHDFGNAGDPGSNRLFALSELGEDAYLTSPLGPHGEQYGDSVSFGASENSMTFGRHMMANGQALFTGLESPSFGVANSGPMIGPIVISEIMYNPATGEDFIELVNTSHQTVNLFDPLNPSNTWQFTKGISYAFPGGISIPAGGYFLVVDGDVNDFRNDNSVPIEVPIFSYEGFGRLSNTSDLVRLSRPGKPEIDGFVPYYSVDQVEYDDGANPTDHFPSDADGNGPSLVRSSLFAFGDDYANWTTGVVGGSPGRVDTDLTGPRVVGVRVSGTDWTRGDVMLPNGPGQQFEVLAWMNINQLTIEFDETVTLAADALSIKGISVPSYSLLMDVAPGESTSRATWTFSTPIAADRLMIDLESELVLDVAGNELDGDWQDNVSLFPSGDGIRGKDFRFEFHLLPGDIDRSGTVDHADFMAVVTSQYSSAGDSGFIEEADIDANGIINALDLVRLRRQIGTSLPAASPQPAAVISSVSAERNDQAVVTTVTSARSFAPLDVATTVTTTALHLRPMRVVRRQRIGGQAVAEDNADVAEAVASAVWGRTLRRTTGLLHARRTQLAAIDDLFDQLSQDALPIPRLRPSR